ncbi:hypothetical protein D3C74_294650 [compost metagenome]
MSEWLKRRFVIIIRIGCRFVGRCQSIRNVQHRAFRRELRGPLRADPEEIRSRVPGQLCNQPRIVFGGIGILHDCIRRRFLVQLVEKLLQLFGFICTSPCRQLDFDLLGWLGTLPFLLILSAFAGASAVIAGAGRQQQGNRKDQDDGHRKLLFQMNDPLLD